MKARIVKRADPDEIMRFFKIVCVILNIHFGFGKVRLNRFGLAFIEEMEKEYDNEILWDKIDRILIDELKLDLPREDYEERERIQRRKNH